MPAETPTDHFISHVVTGGGGNAIPPKSKVEGVLIDSVSEGYRPSLPISGFTYDSLGLYQFFLDIEAMLLHPSIQIPLDIVKAPISVCEHDVTASDDRVKRFAQGQVQVFWDRCIREIMESEYPHGWAGGEVVYVEDRGLMSLKDILVAAPRDVSPLSMHGKAVGVRMRNINAGQVNLWLGSDTIPAKGFWHAHKKQYGRFYGRSQMLTAWRPWKRLAGRDGTEELGDLGTYRFALGNWLIRYPNENANTVRNGQKQARDIAREMGENLKTGGSIELPSTMHTTDAGGGYKWTVEHIATNGNIKELSEREDRLAKQISSAIGMPSEILEAAETGSGFSGRMVPLMVFLLARQHEADSLIQTFNDNILLPLVRWNFGPKAWAKATVKPLLKTFNAMFAPQPATVAGGIGGTPGEPSGGLRTPGIGASSAASGTGAGGGPSPDQIMAAIVQSQMEATKAGDPHANDDEIQHLLDLLPGREKENVTDGYVGGVSKRHHLKAIGVGSNAGDILYGKKAKAAIQRDGEMVDEEDPKAKQQIKATLGDGPHKFASTQFNLCGAAADRIRQAASLIDTDDLAEDGIETEPHVTVRYGLHDDNPDGAMEAISGFGPVEFRLGPPMVFEVDKPGKKFDVVVLKVLPAFGEGKDRLWQLNELLRAVPHTDTHPEYTPHATVAYVKSGRGQAIADEISHLCNPYISVESSEVVFSSTGGEREVIDLSHSRPAKFALGDLDYRRSDTDRFEKTITNTMREMGDKFASIVSGQKPPVVNVTLPSQPFTLSPNITVQAAKPIVVPAPKVSVNVPKQEKPEVKVNVNPTPVTVNAMPGEMTVNVVPQPRAVKIERNGEGMMTGASITEKG